MMKSDQGIAFDIATCHPRDQRYLETIVANLGRVLRLGVHYGSVTNKPRPAVVHVTEYIHDDWIHGAKFTPQEGVSLSVGVVQDYVVQFLGFSNGWLTLYSRGTAYAVLTREVATLGAASQECSGRNYQGAPLILPLPIAEVEW